MSWQNALHLASWNDARFRDPVLVARGSYGWIYRCNDTETGNIAAVKYIPNPQHQQNRYEREIAVLGVVNHPNCVRVILVRREFFCIKIAMEYVDSDLGRHMRAYGAVDPYELSDFMFQTLRGLAHCHSLGIVHCNITPDNLLLESHSRTIKITGFSHSRYIHRPTPAAQITYNRYSPPEILQGWPLITSAVDIWSLGCTFYQLLKGCNEFPGIYHLFHPPYVPAAPVLCYANFRAMFPDLEVEPLDLLTKMLCFWPLQRISVADAMRHDYFSRFRLRI